MGYHYVPQEYLRGFADPTDSDMIWMCDKQTGKTVRASIKQVAQQTAYYTDEVERQLERHVEGPANVVLKKLRAGSRINRNERAALELYIGTMLMRVPRRRRKSLEMYPEVLERTNESVRAQLTKLAHSGEANPDFLRNKLADIDRVIEKYKTAPPDAFMDHIRSPWPSDQVMDCVIRMTWRILPTNSDAGFFLTSDNPAHFFEGNGLCTAESELTFPLSSNLALLGSWQGAPRVTIWLEGRARSLKGFVREVNRRVASGAERFVFYRSNSEDWLRKVSKEAGPYKLNRIVW